MPEIGTVSSSAATSFGEGSRLVSVDMLGSALVDIVHVRPCDDAGFHSIRERKDGSREQRSGSGWQTVALIEDCVAQLRATETSICNKLVIRCDDTIRRSISGLPLATVLMINV